jgi:hypothetical protein
MKLVSESLNELHNFEKKSNSLDSLGVGMKAIIIKWLDEMNIFEYIINDDLTIDVEGDVDLFNKNLDRFPDYIKFGKVGGTFYCVYNQLVSLKGSPTKVGGSFYCSNNQLVSLDGSPMEVGGSFYCGNNKKQFTKEEVRKVCNVPGAIFT